MRSSWIAVAALAVCVLAADAEAAVSVSLVAGDQQAGTTCFSASSPIARKTTSVLVCVAGSPSGGSWVRIERKDMSVNRDGSAVLRRWPNKVLFNARRVPDIAARIAIADTTIFGRPGTYEYDVTVDGVAQAPVTITLSRPPPVYGYVDTHLHQAAEYGNGGRGGYGVLHGSAAGPVATALQDCHDSHAQHGEIFAAEGIGYSALCGLGVAMAGVVGMPPGTVAAALGCSFLDSVGHWTGGWPDFGGWPRYHDDRTLQAIHQAVYISWLKRAWQGGLRLIIATAINSELLCMTGQWFHLAADASAGDPANTLACDDDSNVKKQIDFLKRLETRSAPDGGLGWYDIAYSPEEARAAITAGKLAVILGVEVDTPFGCGWTDGINDGLNETPGRPPDVLPTTSDTRIKVKIATETRRTHFQPGMRPTCTLQQVKDGVDRWYGWGVRHVIPIHIAENGIGGASQYSSELNTLQNGLLNGKEPDMALCNAMDWTLDHEVMTTGADGSADFSYPNLGVRDALGGGGTMKWSWRYISDPYMYSSGNNYNCNARGLTGVAGPPGGHALEPGFGKDLILELAKKQMLIDINHASRLARADILLALHNAANKTSGYPVIMSHSGVNVYGRGVGQGATANVAGLRSEAGLNEAELQRMREVHGGFLSVALPSPGLASYQSYVRSTTGKSACASVGANCPAAYPLYTARKQIAFDCGNTTEAWAQMYLFSVDKSRDYPFPLDVTDSGAVVGVGLGSDLNQVNLMGLAPRFGQATYNDNGCGGIPADDGRGVDFPMRAARRVSYNNPSGNPNDPVHGIDTKTWPYGFPGTGGSPVAQISQLSSNQGFLPMGGPTVDPSSLNTHLDLAVPCDPATNCNAQPFFNYGLVANGSGAWIGPDNPNHFDSYEWTFAGWPMNTTQVVDSDWAQIRLKSNPGLCLRKLTTNYNGEPAVGTDTCGSSTDFLWKMTAGGTLKNGATGTCLGTHGGVAIGNNVFVTLRTCLTATNDPGGTQFWTWGPRWDEARTGVVTVSQFPDMIAELKTLRWANDLSASGGLSNEDLTPLFDSAEQMLQTWERVNWTNPNVYDTLYPAGACKTASGATDLCTTPPSVLTSAGQSAGAYSGGVYNAAAANTCFVPGGDCMTSTSGQACSYQPEPPLTPAAGSACAAVGAGGNGEAGCATGYVCKMNWDVATQSALAGQCRKACNDNKLSTSADACSPSGECVGDPIGPCPPTPPTQCANTDITISTYGINGVITDDCNHAIGERCIIPIVLPPAQYGTCQTPCRSWAYDGTACVMAPADTGTPCNDSNYCTMKDSCDSKGFCKGDAYSIAPENRTDTVTVCKLSTQKYCTNDQSQTCVTAATCPSNMCLPPCVNSTTTCAPRYECSTQPANWRSIDTCAVNGVLRCDGKGFAQPAQGMNGADCDDGNPFTSGEKCAIPPSDPGGQPVCAAQVSLPMSLIHSTDDTMLAYRPRTIFKINGSAAGAACRPNQCEVDESGVADPATGICSFTAKPDGTACDDGNACTTGESCLGGQCNPGTSAVVCPTAAPTCRKDNSGICDKVSGGCVYSYAAVGTACLGGQCDDSGNCLLAPTGLTASASDTGVYLSWTATPDATSYLITRYAADCTTVQATYTVTGTGTAITGLANGTNYCFKITAQADGLTGSAASDASSSVTATPKPMCSTSASDKQVLPNGMVGCAGVVTNANRATLCAPGKVVCTSQDWVTRRAGAAPAYNYWTNDFLYYNGVGPNVCLASPDSPGNYACDQSMRVCAGGADALGNACNWTGCGYNASSPNDFFGGACGNTTAGTLCCDPQGVVQAWTDDAIVAPGANSPSGTWTWTSNPRAVFGKLTHNDGIAVGMHQHYVIGSASSPWITVYPGDILSAWVYVDPNNPPSELMLQFGDPPLGWEHRAYWGANALAWGTDGTTSRKYLGALPTPGVWTELRVPVSQVFGTSTDGYRVYAIAFSQNDGRAFWDRAGVIRASAVVSGTIATMQGGDNIDAFGYGAIAQRAIDGNINGDYYALSVAHTQTSVLNNWWQADLGKVFKIADIDVYNRTDGTQGESARTTNFNVRLSHDGVTWHTTTNYPGQCAAPTSFAYSEDKTARFVQVQLVGTNYLNIAEVRVWAN